MALAALIICSSYTPLLNSEQDKYPYMGQREDMQSPMAPLGLLHNTKLVPARPRQLQSEPPHEERQRTLQWQEAPPEDEEYGVVSCGIDLMTPGSPVIHSGKMRQECNAQLPVQHMSTLVAGNTDDHTRDDYLSLVRGPELSEDPYDGSCKTRFVYQLCPPPELEEHPMTRRRELGLLGRYAQFHGHDRPPRNGNDPRPNSQTLSVSWSRPTRPRGPRNRPKPKTETAETDIDNTNTETGIGVDTNKDTDTDGGTTGPAYTTDTEIDDPRTFVDGHVTISWMGECKVTNFGVYESSPQQGGAHQIPVNTLNAELFVTGPDPDTCYPGLKVGLPQLEECVHIMIEFSGHGKVTDPPPTTGSGTSTSSPIGAAVVDKGKYYKPLIYLPVMDCRGMPPPGATLIRGRLGKSMNSTIKQAAATTNNGRAKDRPP
jgi:hypothetical protein